LDLKLLHLVATVIDACDHQPSRGPGRPPTETIRVVATLRRFLREGTPWRSLVATADQASGSTLRRCLARWAETGLLAKVHALLVGMLRGHPDLILDTCSVRAKRGGDLTGPNPTDRAKRGTKYHVAVDGDGVPVASAATAANINDTLVFERLFLARPKLACKRLKAPDNPGLWQLGIKARAERQSALESWPGAQAGPSRWRTRSTSKSCG
jgi:hypothetical protein